jgi:hypothetical protein
MTIMLILVLFAVLALLYLVRLAKGRGLALKKPEGLASRIRPVDIEAFRNLIDPMEEEFLRSNLPPAAFKRLQRERLRAAIEYISGAASNAAVLIRMGEAARLSPETAIAEAGTRLVESGIRLRLYAVQAIARLYLGIAFPGVRISTVGLAENYERMTGLVFLLNRLQVSNRTTTVAS